MKKLLALFFSLLLCLSLALADQSDQAVYELPGKSNALHECLNTVKVSWISQITGENSPNKTDSRFNVWGTDLGSMAELDGKVYMFCGDTFGSDKKDVWRSNVLFVIEDDDPSDGLTITDSVVNFNGWSKELLRSLHTNNVQMTIIPTNIFSANDKLYCIYMSVVAWGTDGDGTWNCDYSRLAVSEDEGKTWKKLDQIQWPGNSNFIQTANCQVGDTMYFWGVTSGRTGAVALMKCPVSRLEDFEAYSYFVGCDENGDPQWVQGSEGIHQAVPVIEAPAGEISVMYNEYLGNFVITYLHRDLRCIVMREGVTPWGEWSKPVVLARPTEYPALYGAFMLPKYVENNGQSFYFAMSQYFPIYNIMWMKAELPEITR